MKGDTEIMEMRVIKSFSCSSPQSPVQNRFFVIGVRYSTEETVRRVASSLGWQLVTFLTLSDIRCHNADEE